MKRRGKWEIGRRKERMKERERKDWEMRCLVLTDFYAWKLVTNWSIIRSTRVWGFIFHVYPRYKSLQFDEESDISITQEYRAIYPLPKNIADCSWALSDAVGKRVASKLSSSVTSLYANVAPDSSVASPARVALTEAGWTGQSIVTHTV